MLHILNKVLYYTYRTLIFLGRTIALVIFGILALGIVYYFVKNDLPPQEIWTLIEEISPSIHKTLDRIIPEYVFKFVGIKTQ